MNDCESVHYFTCKHCGGVSRQVHRHIWHGEGYPGGYIVVSREAIVPTAKPCSHRSWDESGVNIYEIPEPA